MRSSLSIWILMFSCWTFAGCTKSDGKGSKPSDGSGSSGSTAAPLDEGTGDDDFIIADATPMALLDPILLAAVRAEVAQNAATGTYETSAVAPASSDPYAFAIAIVAAPGKAAGEMVKLIDQLLTLYGAVFGQNGFFKATDLPIKAKRGATTGSRLFKLPEGGAVSYAEVGFDHANLAYPYFVRLFEGGGAVGAELTLTTSLELRRADPVASAPATIHVVHRQRHAAEGFEHIDATYTIEPRSIAASFGKEPSVPSQPARTLVAFVAPTANSPASVKGGYRWFREPAAAQASNLPPPRYRALETGDIEAFRSIISGPLQVQELAFTPNGVPFAAASDPFVGRDYPSLLLEYLVNVLRLPSVNASCATTGSSVKAAFAGGAVPDGVAAAPDDLCRGQTTAPDALVGDLIVAVCESGTKFEVAAMLSGTTATSFNVCDAYFEGVILKNPGYLKFNPKTGTRDLLAAAAVTDEHRSLAGQLDRAAFPDLESLRSEAYPSYATRALSDFAGAETVAP